MLHGRRLALTLAVLLTAVVLCGLGMWQVNRMNERLALIAYIEQRLQQSALDINGASAINPADLDYRPVRLRGVFDPSEEIVLRNYPLNGEPGYHVVTPLRLSGSNQAVLVDRGWIPYAQATPEKRQAFRPPEGEVEIEGVARLSQDESRGPKDSPIPPGQNRRDAWFRVNIPSIQQQVSTPLLPVFVAQRPSGSAQELPVPIETVPPGPGNHFSYAIQWFAFAVILLCGYGAISYQEWQKSALRKQPPVLQHASDI